MRIQAACWYYESDILALTEVVGDIGAGVLIATRLLWLMNAIDGGMIDYLLSNGDI